MSIKKIKPSEEKKLRNQEIYMEIAAGVTKDDACTKWKISLTQLNRILREAREETEQWYKSLPSQTMIQIFRCNCVKVLEEIQRLVKIRNEIKDDDKAEFDFTLKIIGAYLNYNKMVAEGPTLMRQKEVTQAVEKILESNNK